MCSHFWNKSIAISAALAAAGVLTCAAVILNAFMPRGSLLAFFASMLLLGLAVTGAAIGYLWACEKCESYFQGRLDRILSRGKPRIARQLHADKEQERPILAGPEVWQHVLRPVHHAR
jgi:hypothetical protein